ncbi:MAG: hypothetical protein OJF50_005183 [Nitrospira sp.]|nr:hypothetical protein [Nitrospira sp.]
MRSLRNLRAGEPEIYNTLPKPFARPTNRITTNHPRAT